MDKFNSTCHTKRLEKRHGVRGQARTFTTIALAGLLAALSACGPSSIRRFDPGKDRELTGGTTADGRAHTAGSGEDDELTKLKARINNEKNENKSLTAAISDVSILRLDAKGELTLTAPKTLTLLLRFKAESGFPENAKLTATVHSAGGLPHAECPATKSAGIRLRAHASCRDTDCATMTVVLQNLKGETSEVLGEAGVIARRNRAYVQTQSIKEEDGHAPAPLLEKLARDYNQRQERWFSTVEVAWGVSRFYLDLAKSGICPAGLLVETNDDDEGLSLECSSSSLNSSASNSGPETQPEARLTGTLLGNNNRGSLLIRLNQGDRLLYLTILTGENVFAEPSRPETPPSPPLPDHSALKDRSTFIPVDLSNPITKAWERDRTRQEIQAAIDEWSKSKRMTAFLKHAQPNLSVMLEAMDQYQVPAETIFITLIESLYFVEDGYPIEISSSGAVGPWQFLKSTAAWDFLGLTVFDLQKTDDGKKAHPCDERADLGKSSQAAAKYFAYLFKGFPHDPKLGIMSYNWGKNHVNDALRELRNRDDRRLNEIKRIGFDFWHVKEFKFVAGQFVGRDPLRYGLSLPDAKTNTVPRASSPAKCSTDASMLLGP
jgi:hypothetical protein